MSDRTILDALNLLRIAYPRERVDLWAVSNPNQEAPEYVAAVGTGSSGDNPVFVSGHSTPTEAAEALIDKAGDRDPAKLRQQRIDKLKAELAALEAEQQPAPQQLSELVQACESPEPATA